MRYRLRTLLIAMTAACLYLAWAGYCRRLAAFHREQSSQFLLQMVEQDGRGRTREWAENKVSDLFKRFPNDAAQMGNPDFIREGQWNDYYASAVVQESAARKYDRAAWYPWTLFSN
jgi:hypothetical protein